MTEKTQYAFQEPDDSQLAKAMARYCADHDGMSYAQLLRTALTEFLQPTLTLQAELARCQALIDALYRADSALVLRVENELNETQEETDEQL